MSAFVKITENATGQSVELLIGVKEDLPLAKKFPYWRAYFFMVGKLIPLDRMPQKRLIAAKEGDYDLEILRGGSW